MIGEPLKPLRKDECLRIASLFYALGVGHKLERLTKTGVWVPDFCSNRSVARYPWRHRVANLEWAHLTLRQLITDAESAEGSDEVIQRCRESGDRAAAEIDQLRQEKAELLDALKPMVSLMSNGCGELARLPFTWREAFDEAEAVIAQAERRGA